MISLAIWQPPEAIVSGLKCPTMTCYFVMFVKYKSLCCKSARAKPRAFSNQHMSIDDDSYTNSYCPHIPAKLVRKMKFVLYYTTGSTHFGSEIRSNIHWNCTDLSRNLSCVYALTSPMVYRLEISNLARYMLKKVLKL